MDCGCVYSKLITSSYLGLAWRRKQASGRKVSNVQQTNHLSATNLSLTRSRKTDKGTLPLSTTTTENINFLFLSFCVSPSSVELTRVQVFLPQPQIFTISLQLSSHDPIFFHRQNIHIMGRDSTALNHHHDISSSSPIHIGDDVADLIWPFGDLNGIDKDQLRETAYEIFFTACRSSPGFGAGVRIVNQAGNVEFDGVAPGSPSKGNHGVGMAVTSKIKRALGLKMLRRSQSRRTNSIGSPRSLGNNGGASPGPAYSSVNSIVGSGPASRNRRPLTSAEIMRQQMKVTEQSDNRLRKTLMRTLVGQTGRRAETIILPLELLRQLKPSEFADSQEYHVWQSRQLKVLEAGLLLHPSIPFDKTSSLATRLREIVCFGEARPIDVGKNSEHVRALCNCVVSLAWRSTDGSPTEVCHWADGYPFNVHTYISLLRCIFDIKEETVVIDEVDELLELMKKTWSILGMNRSIHNLCFMWVLFEQYVITGQVEADLLSASLTMLNEVANDAKRPNREPLYVKMLGSVLSSIKRWSEKRLLDYHNHFHRGNVELMENMLPLVFAAMKILEEDILVVAAAAQDKGLEVPGEHSIESRIDQYIRSSMRNTSAQLIENRMDSKTGKTVELSDALLHLAKDIQELAGKEKDIFSPVLKKWYPIAGVAAMATLHSCYGTLLKQYMAGVTSLGGEMITVLQRAGKLEKLMIDMAIEESSGCGYEDPGKAVAKEMVPYEVDSVIMTLFKQWVEERLKKARSCVERAKETETWNPKSKTEPYALSATELMTLVKDDINDLFEIPLGVSENLVHNFANDFDQIFCDYISFVAACGSRQSYMPSLPPLTRCSRESNFYKIWKKITRVSTPQCDNREAAKEAQHPRPSTSRGTQRLYIRLNTLHYLLSQIHSFDKALSLSPRIISSSSSTQKTSSQKRRHGSSFSSAVYFESTCSAIQSALEHVCQVAAYRLIFLDSNSVFYDCLYKGDVLSNRIKPALRRLKQNLSLLGAIVTDRAQPMALREVMKASFEAFLMVLLAGGSMRAYYKGDHDMVVEDLDSLKRVFATCGEGLISEDVVELEAKTVDGVVGLMDQSTEQLVEDFSQVALDASGTGVVVVVGSGLGGGGSGSHRLPMPPTTGVWNRTDPNTILRVLCHRNDKAAGYFLKRTFQLPKR